MLDLLSLYVQSLRPIIYIETDDFNSADNEIRALAIAHQAKIDEFCLGLGSVDFKNNKRQLSQLSLINFLLSKRDTGFSDGKEKKTTFLLLKDIHSLIDSSCGANIETQNIISLLRYISERQMYCDGYSTTIFIISPLRYIPKELEHLITIVSAKKPEQKDIENMLNSYADNLGYQSKDVSELALELNGLSYLQIKQILDLAYCDGGYISKDKDRFRINEEKKQIIEKSGLLEFVHTDKQIDDIGGLCGLKTWLQNKGKIFKDLSNALKYGVSMPKGVLILGIPGCGKSLSAKVTACEFHVPLLRLDLGRILGRYVGESEHNLRHALKLAEGISPCVLWVDEIEKAFAGGTEGHDVTVRLMGQFLTWLQEKESTVFVVATANNIDKMPPEFFRKGRFDEVFFVDLPTLDDRKEILKIHLKKRNQCTDGLNLISIANKLDKFSGADIEALVCTAIEFAFFRKAKNVEEEDFAKAMKAVSSSLDNNLIDRYKKQCVEKHWKPAETTLI